MPNIILQGFGSDPRIVTQGYSSGSASTVTISPRACLTLASRKSIIDIVSRKVSMVMASLKPTITLQALGCGGVWNSSIVSGLLAHWRLDEASGTRYDSVGTNHLTDNNSVGQATGILSEAASFIYANQEYLSCTSNSTLQKGDVTFSMAMWVYMGETTNFHFFVSKDGLSAGQREFLVYYNKDDRRICAYVFRPTDSEVIATANSLGEPSSNTWYFIYMEHNATADTLSIRVNNGATDSVATGGALQAASNGEFQIGGDARFPTQYQMDGRIDSVSMWNRVLTSDEQTALYNAGLGLEYPF